MDVVRVSLQPCFVLHHRAYRNSSVILDILSHDFGRVSLVAKGVKQVGSRLKSALQVFQPLQLSWIRKSELGTLCAAEFAGTPILLEHENLYAAMYINELCQRLLAQFDPAPEIFDCYWHSLRQLANRQQTEQVLRLFEKTLLQSLGYEIQLKQEADAYQPIQADGFYHYVPESGFVKTDDLSDRKLIFKGEHLLAFDINNFQDEEVLKVAHRLTHVSLRRLLGDKPLKSRELFIAYRALQAK